MKLIHNVIEYPRILFYVSIQLINLTYFIKSIEIFLVIFRVI